MAAVVIENVEIENFSFRSELHSKSEFFLLEIYIAEFEILDLQEFRLEFTQKF